MIDLWSDCRCLIIECSSLTWVILFNCVAQLSTLLSWCFTNYSAIVLPLWTRCVWLISLFNWINMSTLLSKWVCVVEYFNSCCTSSLLRSQMWENVEYNIFVPENWNLRLLNVIIWLRSIKYNVFHCFQFFFHITVFTRN